MKKYSVALIVGAIIVVIVVDASVALNSIDSSGGQCTKIHDSEIINLHRVGMILLLAHLQ